MCSRTWRILFLVFLEERSIGDEAASKKATRRELSMCGLGPAAFVFGCRADQMRRHVGVRFGFTCLGLTNTWEENFICSKKGTMDCVGPFI